jgi:Tfp pilus assembly protein PilO
MAVANQSSVNIRVIISLILIAAGIAGIFLLLMPKQAEFDENKTLLAQNRTELNRLSSELVELQQVESTFEGSEVTRNDILNMIPRGINQDGIIETLADVASENEVSINSVSFGTGAGREVDLQVVTITLNLTGIHNNLIDFLEGVEDSSRKFKVNTISIQMLENRLENMSVNLEAYYQ